MRVDFTWVIPPFIMAVGIGAGYVFRRLLEKAQAATDARHAREILERARHEAEAMRREAKLNARDEMLKLRDAFEAEAQARRADLHAVEERVAQREANLDRRVALVDRKEGAIDTRLSEIDTQRAQVETLRRELEEAAARVRARHQELAGLTREEARAALRREVEEELQPEVAALVRHAQDEARRGAEAHAREVITTAIERYAAAQVNEVTACTVAIPNEEMKGRIIGREGRNIRSIETETGCSILIDETPGVVVVSGFDPLRREVARRTLEQLIADGRIHPARIEEVVAAQRADVDRLAREAGESALAGLELGGVAPEVVRTLGTLKFRHSFSQNVLQHSVEMAHLMGMMAAEIGLDPAVARRAGLFHDIGKAIDHAVEGGHAAIGADLLRRHGEAAVVCDAVAAHHHESGATNPYAALASAADAITAARPGARSEATELYLQRLEQLEAIARNLPGVKACYAIQAGREIRVFADPGELGDIHLLPLARTLARQISEQVKFPGQIKVTVIRETRCVEYAR